MASNIEPGNVDGTYPVAGQDNSSQGMRDNFSAIKTNFTEAKNEIEVDEWHAAGIANGGVTCEDPPGIRNNGKFKLYLAYLRDPAGNKLCCAYLLPKGT